MRKGYSEKWERCIRKAMEEAVNIGEIRSIVMPMKVNLDLPKDVIVNYVECRLLNFVHDEVVNRLNNLKDERDFSTWLDDRKDYVEDYIYNNCYAYDLKPSSLDIFLGMIQSAMSNAERRCFK